MASNIFWNTGGESYKDKKYTWFNWYGKVIDLPIPEKEGCEFCGWFHYDKNKKGCLEKIEKLLPEDPRCLNLYALWKKDGEIVDCYEYVTPDMFNNVIEQQTVFYYHFDFSADVEINEFWDTSTRYEIGKELTLPTPNKDGYIFDGWYDLRYRNDVPFLVKMPMIFNNEKHMKIKSTYRLYAKWLDQDGKILDCYYGVPASLFETADSAKNKMIERINRNSEREQAVDEFLRDTSIRNLKEKLPDWLYVRLLNRVRDELKNRGVASEDSKQIIDVLKFYVQTVPALIEWLNNNPDIAYEDIKNKVMSLKAIVDEKSFITKNWDTVPVD